MRVFCGSQARAFRQLQSEGQRVPMVGDGINHAPSLAAADLRIAIGTGAADVAIEAADVALASTHIRDVARVIHQSRATMRVVRQNYGLALSATGSVSSSAHWGR